jgi:hypothetical protein
MNRGEQMAQKILEGALGVPLELRDVRTHEGFHDFDILFSEGVVPLEVKTATDQNLRRLFAGFEKVGDELPAAGSWDWHVELHATSDINRLMKEREQFTLGLRAIEEQGIQHVPERGMFPDGSTPELFLETFPEVSSAWGWPHPKGSPTIHLMWPSVGGAVGPGAVNAFVSVFLATLTESGALEKLTRIDASRRHVFIWLEPTYMVVWSSFCDKVLPTERPELPEGLTDVWLAGVCGGNVQAWYLPQGKSWEQVHIDVGFSTRPTSGTSGQTGNGRKGMNS